MQLTNFEKNRIEIWHSFDLEYEGNIYPMSVISVNGIVQGDGIKGFATSKLVYFDLPDKIRKDHFAKAKDYIEWEINNIAK